MTDGYEPPRSAWNVVALVATLGLAAVVAVVAVTRSDRPSPVASGSPTASPSPSPSPTAPGSLAGKGPYVVYAVGSGTVLAYDVSANVWVEMGTIDDDPVPPRDQQPGPGGVVGFATDSGTVWRVDREGLKRVALLPVANPRLLEGGAVSRDGRRFALSSEGADTELLLVNLVNGRTSAFERLEGSSNRYPDEPLIPVAWSLGGSLVYQVPMCDCDTPSPGLYLYDLTVERSSLVPATSQDAFYDRFAISPDGQQLVWPDIQENGYVLRRLAAGRSSATVIRRESDARAAYVRWAADGTSLLLARFDLDSRDTTFELADPETGDTIRTLVGVPDQVAAIALLPGRVLVVITAAPNTEPSLQIVLNGEAKTVAEPGTNPVFLGWLR